MVDSKREGKKGTKRKCSLAGLDIRVLVRLTWMLCMWVTTGVEGCLGKFTRPNREQEMTKQRVAQIQIPNSDLLRLSPHKR